MREDAVASPSLRRDSKPGGGGAEGEGGVAPGRSAGPALSVEMVLHEEEAARARVFFEIVSLVIVVLGAFLPFLGGATWLRLAVAGFATGALLVCVITVALLRDERRWTPALMLVSCGACTVLGLPILYYLGIFSGAAAIFTVGLYFMSLSGSPRVAAALCFLASFSFLIVSAGVASGRIPDYSVFAVTNVDSMVLWYRVVMMQVIFGVTYYLGRSSRRTTQRALERGQEVHRALTQRDAQLAEARHELDWAVRTGEGYLTGQRFGEYQLQRLLGRGGMGEVYVAKRSDGRRVAVKLLHPNMLEKPEVVQRFMREARAAAAVPSEHVAQVYEVGVTPQGAPFIAMELLEGHDLAWHLRRTPALPLPTVVTMVEHAARALAAVRDAGVVHRDLKPANLFLVDSLPHKWKVLDFGLSKVDDSEALTREVAVGTPQYMAPEQARGQRVDHRADLYALGAIAYRAVTGRPMFVGQDIGQVLLDVIYTQPQAPGLFVKIPVEVELILAIALAKNPDDRFVSVEEFARALRLAAGGELDEVTHAKGWQLVKRLPWGTSRRKAAAT